MTKEQFEKAQRIEKSIDFLRSHLGDIARSRISESIDVIRCQFNPSYTNVILFEKFMRKDFVTEYINTVKDKIDELEAEFEAI